MWPPAQSSSMCGLSRPVRELLTLHFHQGSGVCGPCPKPATELLSPVTQEGLAEVDWREQDPRSSRAVGIGVMTSVLGCAGTPTPPICAKATEEEAQGFEMLLVE